MQGSSKQTKKTKKPVCRQGWKNIKTRQIEGNCIGEIFTFLYVF